MKILVINGPNLNLLGIREPAIYGTATYGQLVAQVVAHGQKLGQTVEVVQSNHEGVLVDTIQQAYGRYDALVLNAAAYTHTSIAILDALRAVGLPTVEVHLSAPSEREPYRHISYVREYTPVCFCGKGIQSYLDALDYLANTQGDLL
ncbi:MAG: 3-dehydroquinate dehydratase [Clostridia bacterium]|nr:3-dehydroquinate dehydratase [Clostridia bacterium]